MHGLLLIDSLERCSELILDLILSISRDLPKGWAIASAVNSENPRYATIRERLALESPTESPIYYQLDSLSSLDVLSWLNNDRGDIDISLTDVTMIRETLQGRPLYLKLALQLDDPRRFKVEPTIGLRDLYQNTLSNLAKSERDLVFAFSLLSEDASLLYTTIEVFLRNLGNEDPLKVILILTRLQMISRADDGSDRYFLAHETMNQPIFRAIPNQMRGQLAQDLAIAIKNSIVEQFSGVPHLIYLSKYVGSLFVGFSKAVCCVEHLLEHGLSEAAFEAGTILLEFVGEGTLEECRVNRALGESCYNMGSYNDAKEYLRKATSHEECGDSVTALIKAKVAVRVGDYAEAMEILNKVVGNAESTSDVQSLAEAWRMRNLVHRDIENYEEALTCSEFVIRELLARLAMSDRSRMRGRILRAHARTLAFLGRDAEEAVCAAKEALEISRELRLERDESNAYFALGEVARHLGHYENAIGFYVKGVSKAFRLTALDSYLWGVLGLADAHLLLGSVDESRRQIEHIGPILSSGRERYPVEYAHWRFSNGILQLIDGVIAREAFEYPAFYLEKDLKWPSEYLETLNATGSPNIAKRF